MKRVLYTIMVMSPMLLIMICFCNLLQAIMPYVLLYFTSEIMNQLYYGGDRNTVIGLVLGISFTTLVMNITINFIKRYKNIKIIELIHAQDAALAEKCYSINYSQFESADVQGKLETIRQSKFQMGNIFQKVVVSIEKITCSFCGIIIAFILLAQLVYGIFTNEQIIENRIYCCIPICVVFLVATLLYIIIAKNGIRHNGKIHERFVKVAPINKIYSFYRRNVFQNYHYGKDIRVYNLKKLIGVEFEKTLKIVKDFMDHVGLQEGRYHGVNGAVRAILLGCIYLVLGIYAYKEYIDVGDIVKYIGAASLLTNHLTDIVITIVELSGTKKYIEQYYEFMDIESDNLLGEHVDICQELTIEFHDVSYCYPNENHLVLSHVSFSITQGEHIAIVGMNGSGKTTCIRLICRLYRPTEGTITLNGKDIWEYDYSEYVNLLSVVFQDFKLFAFTMKENISAATVANQERMVESLKQAELWERVEKIPKGVEQYIYTEFDKNGIEFSGGEAQKIAIAKAIYKDAPLLIMDEPTASLDPIAESQVYQCIEKVMKEKTIIFISHRLSSCIFCDKVLVLDSGCLCESGTHNELLLKNGQYSKLWKAQAKYYE